jgi:hypothetical protein
LREFTFRLAKPLPLLNVWERMHWRRKGKFKKDLAWEILALLGATPAQPFERARIRVFRHSIFAPDQDNLIVKALLDVLQPPGKRHPYGLGVIAGDDPAHVTCDIQHVFAQTRKAQCTEVLIQEI